MQLLPLPPPQRGSVCSISRINRGIAGLTPLSGGSVDAAFAEMPGVAVIVRFQKQREGPSV